MASDGLFYHIISQQYKDQFLSCPSDITTGVVTVTVVAVMSLTSVIPSSIIRTSGAVELTTIPIRREENFLQTCQLDRANKAKDTSDLRN